MSEIEIIEGWAENDGRGYGDIFANLKEAEENYKNALRNFEDKIYFSDRVGDPANTSISNSDIYNEMIILQKQVQERNNSEPANTGNFEIHEDTVLIFLLGYADTPLYLSAGAYLPGKIIILMSSTIENRKAMKDRIRRKLKEHVYKLLLRNKRDIFDSSKFEERIKFKTFKEADNTDNGMEVFCKLKTIVENINKKIYKRIILDITGAKKTMVAGAFMYGVYNGFGRDKDKTLHYVDHKKYDTLLNRPAIGSCFSTEVGNIYTAFKLGERDKLRMLFNAEDYAGARILASEIVESIEKKQIVEGESGKWLQKMKDTYTELKLISGAYEN